MFYFCILFKFISIFVKHWFYKCGHSNKFLFILLVNTLYYSFTTHMNHTTATMIRCVDFTFGDDDHNLLGTTSSKVVVKNYFKYVVDWIRQGVQSRRHPPRDV